MSNIQNQLDFKIGAFDCGACCAIMWGHYITSNDYIFWLSMAWRRELIGKYGIENESICESCAKGVFCAPCSLCQVQREMGKRQEHCGGMCAQPPANQPSLAEKAMGQVIGAIAGAAGPAAGMPRMWGSGLCNCNCAEIMEGIFCPCLIVGYMSQVFNAGRVAGVPRGGPAALDPASCVGCLFWPFGYLYSHRREVIQRYTIVGESHTMSCINTICCTLCSICQARREMGYSNEWPGGLCVGVPPPRAV